MDIPTFSSFHKHEYSQQLAFRIIVQLVNNDELTREDIAGLREEAEYCLQTVNRYS